MDDRRPLAIGRSGRPHGWVAQQRDSAAQLLTHTLDTPVHLERQSTMLSTQPATPRRAAPALAELSDAGITLTDFARGQPSLDEAFLALTGQVTDTTLTETTS